MKGKILVLKGESLYNVLRIAADDMVKAFQNKGYDVIVLDLVMEEDANRLNDVLRERLDLIFSIQALLFDFCLTDEKTAKFSAFKNTPVFGHIVDHPIYHNARVATIHGDNMYVGCIDRKHVEYIQNYYPGVKNALFIPHGGFLPQRIVPYEERSIDLYFPCSYKRPSKIRDDIDKLPQVYRNVAYLLIERMLEDRLLTLQDALYAYLEKIRFEYTSEEFSQLMCILNSVDKYIREYSRDKCIRCLIESGIRVTVSGSGWEDFDADLLSEVHVLGSEGIDFLEVVETMADSKFVLNNAPAYQYGTHERIFTSMLCGAICLTHDFPIMHEEFIDGEDILLYSDDNLPLFIDRIKELLNSPDQAKKIANRGYQKAKQSHTWANNAETILRIVGLED